MSETVKLIIEIPKEIKQEFDKTESIALKGAYFDLDGIIGKAIQNGIPLDDVKAEINEERVFSRDDFRQYKVDILGVDPETVDDEYPNAEFHEGMERAVEIIGKYIGGKDGNNI